MRKGLVYTLLIFILALGTFFRLNHINDESLWLDEGVTYYNSTGASYTEIWDKTSELDQSPPFYYFIMHNYLNIFGENEFGFRLIPLIFGVLSILFLFLLMSKMFNYEIGIFSAFLLAINPFHIGFSIESRMYVLLSLETLISCYFLYKAMTCDERGYFSWLVFIIVSILGVYTHNFFFFVLLSQAFIFFILLFSNDKKIGRFLMGILSVLLVLISYLPWLPNFLKQLNVDRYWMASNSVSDIKDYFLDFSNQDTIISLGFITLIVIGILWMILRVRSNDYKKYLISTLVLITILLVGFLIPLFYSIYYEPILKIRYVVYIVPILMGLVSLGLYTVRKLSIIFPVFLLIGFTYLFIPWQASSYPVEFGEDYRGLVEEVIKKPDTVVVHTPSIAHVINFYNNNRFKVRPFPYSDDLKEYNIYESDKNKFRDLVKNYKSFYLVITHTHENPPGLLYVWSDAYCRKHIVIPISGIELYYFSDCR